MGLQPNEAIDLLIGGALTVVIYLLAKYQVKRQDGKKK